jgi:regulator of cell morphogenesis and NO signaling
LAGASAGDVLAGGSAGGFATGVSAGDALAMDYGAWPLDLLADFIEKKYHREATVQMPQALGYLEKITAVHGAAHPELQRIKTLFEESVGELTKHMKREELILFPYIRKMVQTKSVPETLFGPIGNPISAMQQEHEEEGQRLRMIAQLSGDYTVPSDGCSTYRVCYSLLKEFERTLHFHIHLENNLLFPKAMAMAESLGEVAS